MWLLVWLSLGASSAAAVLPTDELSPLPDGTLLFLENCSSVVERSTHGEIAHVAIVFGDEDRLWVYEATPAKVRRVKLEDYLADLARSNQRRKGNDEIRVLALRPQSEYTPDEA